MEVILGTHKEPEDFISGMGDNVITNILHRLPLQDAVRTGILSKNWRFKWTMLSHLVLDYNFFHYLSKKEGNANNYGRIISLLLLHIKGRITKFDLSISEQCGLDVDDINHWILFLSRNRIKDLTIWKSTEPLLMVPTHFFSCLELKHLKLSYCCFDPPASFYGFPNLLRLELRSSKFEIGKLEEFFTRCPVLEILNMNVPYSQSQMKITEFSKLANLKILSLFMCNLDNRMFISSSSIFELVGFLPKLQELDMDFIRCKITDGGANRQLFPVAFPSLKTLKLTRIYLDNGMNLSFAFEMIRSFPNLQTLKISAIGWDAESTPTFCSLERDYNTMTLLQLQSVVFRYSTTSENEVCLIKYLLACSPVLNKIVICPRTLPFSDQKFMFARKLLKLYRASPRVDIELS